MSRSFRRQQILRERERLPVSGYKNQVFQLLDSNQCILLISETGSGKTTQIPQWCIEYLQQMHLYGDKPMLKVICTQPRRVAAMSIAKRVAEEMDVNVGSKVGYSIRFENCISDKTVLKYVTDGMLLQEAKNNRNFNGYGIIILDEAHERTLATDILMGMIKDTLKKRKDLKVIIMSATVNSSQFQEYFDCPLLDIPGRLFPVQIMHSEECVEDYLESAASTAINIHQTEEKGDILIFLTGEDEIEVACSLIRDGVKHFDDTLGELRVIPLYSNLPFSEQQHIFDPPPLDKNGKISRKCIVATNIAETSITIDGIVYVIDTGFCKRRYFYPESRIDFFTVCPISKAAAIQRTGRAGRTSPGKCYRLYEKEVFENLSNYTTPEILMCNLAEVILALKRLGIDDLVHFDYMSPPCPAAMIRALDLLHDLGAIDNHGNLTDDGYIFSQFPLDPTLSRMLIMSSRKYKCSNEILILVAMLSVPPVFNRPARFKLHAKYAHQQFCTDYDSDHLTLINIYTEFICNDQCSEWCRDNYLRYQSLKQAVNIKNQLARMMDQMDLERCSLSFDDPNGYEKLCKCILEGCFSQVANYGPVGTYISVKDDIHKIHIHTNSELVDRTPEWVVYSEFVFTFKQFIRTVSQIEPRWLFEVAPHFYNIDEWPPSIVQMRLSNVQNEINAEKALISKSNNNSY